MPYESRINVNAGDLLGCHSQDGIINPLTFGTLRSNHPLMKGSTSDDQLPVGTVIDSGLRTPAYARNLALLAKVSEC